jgi:Leucine-rich repeat (LRR) protein
MTTYRLLLLLLLLLLPQVEGWASYTRSRSLSNRRSSYSVQQQAAAAACSSTRCHCERLHDSDNQPDDVHMLMTCLASSDGHVPAFNDDERRDKVKVNTNRVKVNIRTNATGSIKNDDMTINSNKVKIINNVLVRNWVKAKDVLIVRNEATRQAQQQQTSGIDTRSSDLDRGRDAEAEDDDDALEEEGDVITRSRSRGSKSHARITILSLHGANITRIRAGAFARLPGLRVLDASNNPVIGTGGGEGEGRSAIARRAFRGVEASLEKLSLAACSLHAVPTDSLDSLHSLRFLYLQSNNISLLPAGAFRGLGELVKLHLYGNGLHTIEPKAFLGLRSLRYLSLYDNLLSQPLHGSIFIGLSNLTSLDMAANRIARVERMAFRHLSRLRHLNLDDNAIFALHRGAMAGLERLDRLTLRANPLTSLDTLALLPLTSLRHLVLPYVGNEPLTSSTFASLRHRLQTLHLDEVTSDSLADGALASLRHLRHLTFSNYSGRFDGLSASVLTMTSVQQASRERSSVDVAMITVHVAPLGDCSCRQAWIGALTARGTTVHGECLGMQGLRPVLCGPPTLHRLLA